MLEDKFRQALAKAQPLIEAKLKAAEKAIADAVKIAEKHGVPFKTGDLLDSGMDYIPESFHEKWAVSSDDGDGGYELTADTLELLTGVGAYALKDTDAGGWCHSTHCWNN